MNVTNLFLITDGSAGRDFSFFSWPNHIPYILPPYLFDWIDVIGDDNCRFRAIAITELGGEEAWPLLRRTMSMEMQMNRDQYLGVYRSAETLENAIFLELVYIARTCTVYSLVGGADGILLCINVS